MPTRDAPVIGGVPSCPSFADEGTFWSARNGKPSARINLPLDATEGYPPVPTTRRIPLCG